MTSSELSHRTVTANGDATAKRLARHILRDWPIIGILAVLAGAAGYLASASDGEIYHATTTIQVGVDSASGQGQLRNPVTADRDAATNASLVTLPAVRDRAARALGGRVTSEQLLSAVKVDLQPGSDLIQITASAPEPKLAARIANANATAFVEARSLVGEAQFEVSKKRVRDQLIAAGGPNSTAPIAKLLRTRLRELIVAGPPAPDVQVVQAARTPTFASNPDPKRRGLLALVGGVAIGFAIALLRARIDDRLRDPEEFGEIWPLPFIGSVPRARELKRWDAPLSSPRVREAFALARTNLRFIAGSEQPRTLLVASCDIDEGKSTVVWQLAVSTALAGASILVIDADLRRPGLGDRLGLGESDGLSDVLGGGVAVEDVILSVDLPSGGSFDVLPAGTRVSNPLALMEGDAFASVIGAMSNVYEVVVVDGPPALAYADPLILAGLVDGVIVVSRSGRVHRGDYVRFREQVESTGARVLGRLFNGAKGGPTAIYGNARWSRAKAGR